MGLNALEGGEPDNSSIERLHQIAERLNSDLLRRSRVEAEAGAEVIVWSEHASRVTDVSEAELVRRACSIARGASTYRKAKPIVGQESSFINQGNESVAILDTDHARFAVAICHDLDFAAFMRQVGRDQIDILLAPSSDWEAITPLHPRMAIFRAVENGCSLVRPCSNGLSLSTDAFGRVIARQMDHDADGSVMISHVPVGRQNTLYPRIGDLFAYLNLAAVVLVLVSGIFKSNQARSAMRDNHRIFQLLVPMAILIGGATAPAVCFPETKLIPFEIQDQFDRPHTERELNGRNVLFLCADRKGSQYQGKWLAALRDSLESRGHAESITLVEVADLRGVPFFIKGSVKKKFPKESTAWVLMDWKGSLARAYDLEKDKCNIVLFDRSGGLLHKTAVEDLELPVLENILDQVEEVDRREAPAP